VAAVSEQAWNLTASVVNAVVSVPSDKNNVTSVVSTCNNRCMSVLSPYDFLKHTLLGLYAVDDPENALDAVFDVAILSGTPIVDASVWFPRWSDLQEKLYLPVDVYSYAARETLATQLQDLVPPNGDSPLDATSKAVDFSDDPIRLGFGRASTPVVECAILAACVGDHVAGDTGALVAIGSPEGGLEHLLRLRAFPENVESSLPGKVEALARNIARVCCGVMMP